MLQTNEQTNTQTNKQIIISSYAQTHSIIRERMQFKWTLQNSAILKCYLLTSYVYLTKGEVILRSRQRSVVGKCQTISQSKILNPQIGKCHPVLLKKKHMKKDVGLSFQKRRRMLTYK